MSRVLIRTRNAAGARWFYFRLMGDGTGSHMIDWSPYAAQGTTLKPEDAVALVLTWARPEAYEIVTPEEAVV